MMYQTSTNVVFVLFAFLPLLPAPRAAAAPDFDTALASFEAAVRLPDRSLVLAEERGTFTHNGVPDFSRSAVTKLICKRDGRRIDITQQDTRADAAGNLNVAGPTYRFVVGEQNIFRQSRAGGDTVAVVYQDRDAAIARAAWGMLAGRALEGALDGEGLTGSVAAALRSGYSKEITIETAGPVKGACVLRSMSPSGAHALWIDPATYLPVRIEVVRTSKDLFNEKLMEPGVIERKIVCDAFESREFAGRRLPVAVRVTETTTFAGGDVDQLALTHRNTTVELQPDFSGAGEFVMQMPEGTPVVFEPRVGVNYAWHGGKPVAVVDPDVVAAVNAAVENARVAPTSPPKLIAIPAAAAELDSSPRARTYITFAGIALFVGCVCLIKSRGPKLIRPAAPKREARQ